MGLDDHLDAEARERIDSTARERYGQWRERRRAALTVDGVDLSSIWEIELLAGCFQPAARIEVGLPRALEALGAGSIEIETGARMDLLETVATRASATTTRVPRLSAGRLPAPATPPFPARLMGAAGVPAVLRGQVLCVHYWTIAPVYRRLASQANGARPAASGVILPGLGTRDGLRTALRGGWLGHPGARARRRAEVRAAEVIAAARVWPADADELDLALDRWALHVLAERAATTLAAGTHARRAFAGAPLGSLLVPFDGTADVALLVDEAHRAGISTLLVQHGFDSRLGVPDKERADVIALWSERDRGNVPPGARGRVVVTGNPGAEHLAGAQGRRAPRRDRTLVLVDYASRMSSLIAERVGQRHVLAALEGLARARPGSTVVVRPHPSDRHADAYLRGPEGLRTELDTSTPIEELLTQVDLCIGSMSTATLQAGALGVPVVHLEVAGYRRPWPLDGSVVPTAADADELAEAVRRVLADPEVAGQAELREALGVRPGAVAAVCELLEELVAGRQ